MASQFTVACIQNRAGPELAENLRDSEALCREARGEGADLICLPEFFSCLDVHDSGFEVGASAEEGHPALDRFRALAAELDAWILLGSLGVLADTGKTRNRSFMIDASGGIVTRYDKIHLFDVDLSRRESYRESDLIEGGGEAVLAPTPWGLMGLSVCYDLRFAGLYRALAQGGASFLSVPAAFTKTTGEAHWHVLLRARAIETGSYVFAPCQFGTHGKGVTYGHSLIVDPWGEVLADGGEGRGVITAEIDTAKVESARRRIPALTHDRPFAGPHPAAVTGVAGE